MKWILRILGVVAVLLIAAVGVGWLMINSLAKAGIERGGSRALGAQTTVDDVAVSLWGGTVDLGNLKIANPPGFSDSPFLKTGTFSLGVDAGSLFSDTVQVRHFELDGVTFSIEQTLKGSNLGAIMENLRKLGSGGDPNAPGKKVRVDRIVIRNVTARFDLLSELHGGEAVELHIPEVVLEDVSNEPGGVDMPQLIRRVLTPLAQAVIQRARGRLPGDAFQSFDRQVSATLSELPGRIGRVVRSGDANEALRAAERNVRQGANSILNRVLPGAETP